MSKKKKSQKKQAETAEPKSICNLPKSNLKGMEKTLSDIGKLLSEHEFDSIDEVNAFLQEKLASGEGLISSDPTLATPLEQAQDLMYQAWDATGRQRVKLARKALEVSKDCADAYVLLAEDMAKGLTEAKQLYEQAVDRRARPGASGV